MKRETTLFLASLMAAGVLAGGCVSSHRTVVVREQPVPVTREVVVATEPPPPQQEIVGVAPSPEHVWVSGYWTFHNDRWVWRKGRWERRPHRESVWIAGHWDRTSAGWVWRPGHWA